MIRIGLLGAARIAPQAIIAPVAARHDCAIVAVGCRDKDKALTFIQDNNLNAKAVTYDVICSDPDIDMVYCALPPSLHEKWVSLALRNGKAVLCEKPFSMGEVDAKSMIEAAGNTLVMEAFHYYFHPAFQSVLARYKAGEFGKALNFHGTFNAVIPKTKGQLRYVQELGGGALMDLGCYPLHAMRHLIGEPEVISAKADIESGVDVALTAEMMCGNIPAEIRCDMGRSAKREDYFILECEKTRLRFNSFVAPHRGYEIIVSSSAGDKVEIGTGPITYTAQLDNFIAALSGEAPLLAASDATAQMRAIENIYRKVGLRA